MARVTGFGPVADQRARVLILGSMPGVASLQACQYYALPRNAFWPIMGRLFGAGADLPYEQRLQALKDQRIALWDVLAQCDRPGSLDSAIDMKTARPNDFKSLFRRYRSIRHVVFNGAKAADLYRRRVLPQVQLEAPYLTYTRLPSTSPAMASLDFEQKLEAWSVLTEHLQTR
ncbi:MAG TPA: DNA-deoxyinosine glycosylase [Chromatiales bacterium]|nr:DNA-deoxyinosine glycosylase [Chromatiales bacterium]